MAWAEKALAFMESGQLRAAAAELTKACEQRSARGLCRVPCEKCRLEAAKRRLLAGHIAPSIIAR